MQPEAYLLRKMMDQPVGGSQINANCWGLLSHIDPFFVTQRCTQLLLIAGKYGASVCSNNFTFSTAVSLNLVQPTKLWRPVLFSRLPEERGGLRELGPPILLRVRPLSVRLPVLLLLPITTRSASVQNLRYLSCRSFNVVCLTVIVLDGSAVGLRSVC